MRLIKLASILAMLYPNLGSTSPKADGQRCFEYTDNIVSDVTHTYQVCSKTKYVKCDNRRFSVILNCPTKIPLISSTIIGKDEGSLDTSSRDYKIDVNLGYLCQQHSSDTYSSVVTGFDVGHLKAIELLDDDLDSALETKFMTNSVTQQSNFNRHGAWRRAEILSECNREEFNEDLTVYSGILIGSETTDDHYLDSHGLAHTPDRFYRILLGRSSGKLFSTRGEQNNKSAKASVLIESRATLNALLHHGDR